MTLHDDMTGSSDLTSRDPRFSASYWSSPCRTSVDERELVDSLRPIAAVQ